MPDFITVDAPSALQAIPFDLADVVVLGRAEEINIGLGGATAQLNCRYADGVTYVQPIGQANTALPWKFAGYVAPADCLAWFVAQVAPEEATVDDVS